MTLSSMVLALAGFSFMLTVIWGEPLIRIFRHFKVGDLIRIESPQRHQVKMGTPTMGGVLFILPVTLITLLLNAASLIGFSGLGRSVLVPLGTMLGFAVLGALDDIEKLLARRQRASLPTRNHPIYVITARSHRSAQRNKETVCPIPPPPLYDPLKRSSRPSA